MALYFSAQRSDAESRQMFSEAIDAAKMGLTEEGTGGFRQITEMLRRAPPTEVMPWMAATLASNLLTEPTSQDAANAAFACIDMVVVAGRFETNDSVASFIACTATSIRGINQPRMKELAKENLVRAKNEAGIVDGELSNSLVLAAIREARTGNAPKSYAIVSGLGQNLYVDHRIVAYLDVFDDAIHRGDIGTAAYFAERPVRQLFFREIYVWQKLAETQLKTGDRKSAIDSYRKASYATEKIGASPQIFLFDIKGVLGLGESMLRSGMKNEGRRCVALANSLLDRISVKQMDDRISASTAVAELLWKTGLRTQALNLLRTAYADAHTYDLKQLRGDMKKARLLASVAQSFSRLAAANR